MQEPSTHLYIIYGLFTSFLLVDISYIRGTCIFVISITWSDRPFKVAGSYSIVYAGSFVSIRSMQDRSSPLVNVYCAGGPGCSPFRIYQPCCSHKVTIHGAR